MKKLISLIFIVLITNFCLAQQWNTSGNNIYNTNSGNVGIGTQNPNATLSVFGSNNPAIELAGSSSSFQMGVASCNGCFSPLANTNDVILKSVGSGVDLHLIIPTTGLSKTRSIIFSDADEKIMTVWNGGKVQIGNTTTPGNYRLYVEDGILTEEVKIALKNSSSWADYVFSPEYELYSLDQVESHIKSHGHLYFKPDRLSVDRTTGI